MNRRVQRLELVLQRAAVRVVCEVALQERHGLGVVSGVCVGVGGVEIDFLTLHTVAEQLLVGRCGRRIVGGCVCLLRLSADPAFLRGWHLVPSRQCYGHDGDHCDRDFHKPLRAVRVCRGSGVGGDVAHAQHLVDTIVIIERSDGCRALAVSGVGILGGGGLGVFVRVVSGGVGIRVIRVVSVKIVGSVSIAVERLVRIIVIRIIDIVIV